MSDAQDTTGPGGGQPRQHAIPQGWIAQPFTAFDTLAGPIYFPGDGAPTTCGFLADERHANRRGVVHGGMICTAFDVSLGTASRAASAPHHHATLKLAVQFVSGMMLGEFAIIRSEVIRATRSIVFVRAVMTVDERIVATADGIWKVLRPRVEP